MGIHHPISSITRASPVAPPCRSLLIPSSQLSFDCCVVLSMVSTEGHSSIPPPYFLMRISVVAPKSQQPIMVRPIPWVGALLYGPLGSHGAMIWWRRWPAHGERGHHLLVPGSFHCFNYCWCCGWWLWVVRGIL
jgi:hypothetical protein